MLSAKWITAAALALSCGAASADGVQTELKRSDLTGTQMEVIISLNEFKPGETIARHIHHGEEAFYVLEGATAQLPDGKQINLPAGTAAINMRDVAHAGFKIVGDKVLKYLAVHVVDKGKPVYDTPK